jgi:alcohol dehydrogenase (cytochrome c)
MRTPNRGVRLFLHIAGLLLVSSAGILIILLAVPRFRWRVQIVYLKAVDDLPGISWKEIYHMGRHGDPYNLKGLVTTHNPYQVIKDPYVAADDISDGAKLFQSHCAQCHGTEGVGGAGPALKQHVLRRGGSDWAIFKTVSHGIAGTAMPASSLPENDCWQLVSYVKSIAEAFQPLSSSLNFTRLGRVAPVHYEKIVASAKDTRDWLTYSGSYNGQRFSSSDQITTSNAQHLHLLWMRQYTTTEPYIETSPLIIDGFMFITVPPNRVEALDAKTGALVWNYDRQLPQHMPLCCGYVNRGLAVLGSNLFFGTLDAHLVALDIKTGSVSWDVQIADYKTGYSITSAPLALKNMIITGVAGGEYGARCFLEALDASTGKQIWHFDTVPQPGQPGSETWEPGSLKTGGAPTWLTGSFDPELNLLYWPVGNPSPNYNGDSRRGDNLYSNSVIALDADTGNLRWYFQFTPHDLFDWDATEILIAFDETVDGKRQRLLAQADRNGFYYVLDRENGHFLRARAMVKQDWAQDIDAQGRPVRNPGALPTPEGTTVFPSVGGATNWMSPSYSPITGLVYVPIREWGGVFYSRSPEYRAGDLFTAGSSTIFNDPPPKGIIRAFDASTGELRWEYNNNTSATVGGLLSTKGGVVFGSVSQAFVALDAKTGHELWRMETGGWIKAAPVTYILDGKQMVTIAAGHDILTFSLE